MNAITRIHIEGFRSLRDVTLEPGPVTVLIGPNGAGKSNLLGFLRMLAMLDSGSLRRFVGLEGGASSLLFRGPASGSEIAWRLDIRTASGEVAVGARLARAAGDQFVFLDEYVEGRKSPRHNWRRVQLGVGHQESRLEQEAERPSAGIARSAQWALRHMNYYHFHDTSAESPLRSNARAVDHHYLRSNGSNLAAFLLARRQSTSEDGRAAWRFFEGLVQRVAPYIKSLEPTPNVENPEAFRLDDPNARIDQAVVRLDWIDDNGSRFGVGQLSDGTLRAIALFAALTQHESRMPSFVTIDEPELGLHPAAIALLVELVRSVSGRCQVLVASQSSALLNLFDPNEVVVVERSAGATVLRRLDAEALGGWLEDYQLAELYDKNVLGGRP